MRVFGWGMSVRAWARRSRGWDGQTIVRGGARSAQQVEQGGGGGGGGGVVVPLSAGPFQQPLAAPTLVNSLSTRLRRDAEARTIPERVASRRVRTDRAFNQTRQ